MLPIERVFSRIQGKPVDRIPFALTTPLYGAKLSSCPLDSYYSDPLKYLAGQIAIAGSLEQDILFTPFAFVMEAEAFGSKSVGFEKNPPNLKTPAITTYLDIDKLKLPDIENHPRLNYIRESTRLMAKEFKDQIPVAAICTSPPDLPALIMGIENWIDTLMFHPAEANRLMELTSTFFVNYANALLADGASCIFTLAAFSNSSMITWKIAHDMLVPVLQKCYASINGPIVFHHGGSSLIPFLDLLKNLPNVVGYVVGPKDSFNKAREIIGSKPAIMGNLNGQQLQRANPKIIESWCLKILENRKDDNKFILTSSNADIPYDTPVDNLKIIGRTVRNFSR